MQNFKISTEIYFNKTSLDYLKTVSDKNIFIITDPFMIKSGTINKITDRLQNKNITIFSDICPDPPIEIISLGIEKMKENIPETVIALGGGSAIDAAKVIIEFSKKILNINKIVFIAIPTTSGTGSEVTSFSVITDRKKGIKYPLVSDSLLPNIAILDPDLVKSVPNFITADTGMDVLTHAIEAYVSKNSTDFSDALALRAINLTFSYLPICYEDGENIEAREKMHNASCLAGMAFNLASLGINHSIAHIIGGKLHIPHGRANSILLPHIIEFNSEIEGYSMTNFSKASIKYSEIAKYNSLSNSNVRNNVKALINKIKSMQKLMRMPLTLKDAKADLTNFENIKEEMAKIAIEDKCTITNPKSPTKQDIIKILEKVKG